MAGIIEYMKDVGVVVRPLFFIGVFLLFSYAWFSTNNRLNQSELELKLSEERTRALIEDQQRTNLSRAESAKLLEKIREDHLLMVTALHRIEVNLAKKKPPPKKPKDE